jgi:hypothetical protein
MKRKNTTENRKGVSGTAQKPENWKAVMLRQTEKKNKMDFG